MGRELRPRPGGRPLRLPVLVGLLLASGAASGVGLAPECPPGSHVTPSGDCEDDALPRVPHVPSPSVPSAPDVAPPPAPEAPVPGDVPVPDAPAAPRPAPPPSIPTLDADVALPELALPRILVPTEGLQAPGIALPTLTGTKAAPPADLVTGGYDTWRPSSPAPPDDAPAYARPTPARDALGGSHGAFAALPATWQPSPSYEHGFPSAAAAGAFGAALLWAALALHRRLAASRLLDNAVRRRLLDHVLAHPGTTCTEAAHAADVHYATAERHLRILAEFGHVTALCGIDGPRYFENHGRFSADAKRVLAWLRRPGTAAFLDAVARSPGAGVVRLAATLGVAKSTASRRASLLREAGILEPHDGGFIVTARAQEARTSLALSARASARGSATVSASAPAGMTPVARRSER